MDIDHRPYTAAELNSIRTRHIPDVVNLIRLAWAAGDEERATFRAALALGTAAYYLQRGAVDEAHRLIAGASSAWDEGWNAKESAN